LSPKSRWLPAGRRRVLISRRLVEQQMGMACSRSTFAADGSMSSFRPRRRASLPPFASSVR
ncbi:hypothetical protein BG000_000400, partial [Podila horticola]